jgi:hypothetical protein
MHRKCEQSTKGLNSKCLYFFPQFIFMCKKITYKNRAVLSQALNGHYIF